MSLAPIYASASLVVIGVCGSWGGLPSQQPVTQGKPSPTCTAADIRLSPQQIAAQFLAAHTREELDQAIQKQKCLLESTSLAPAPVVES